MDFEFIVNFTPMFVKAAVLTLELAFYGILLSILIGFVCVLVQYYKIKFWSFIINAYIELSRNTPLLIQLFFLYYGLPRLGVSISSFTCAVIGLSFLGGSYMAESFRAGFEAVKKQQIEAGLSIGLSQKQLLIYVILPQAFSVSLGSVSANIIFLLKETSIVSIVALADLVYVAKDLIGLYYKTNESLFMLVISYLIIILPVSLGLGYLEKRLNHARA